MASLVDEVNDKHLGPWAEACNQSGVENTPLTPYIDQELLYNKHLYLDPSKLESTGFSWQVPQLTREKLREVSFGMSVIFYTGVIILCQAWYLVVGCHSCVTVRAISERG
jgi:hypothetical protein